MKAGNGAFLYFLEDINEGVSGGFNHVKRIPKGSLGIMLFPPADTRSENLQKMISCYVPETMTWNNMDSMAEIDSLKEKVVFMPPNTFAFFDLRRNSHGTFLLSHPYVFDMNFHVIKDTRTISESQQRIGIWSAKPEDFWGIKTKT